LSLPNEQPHFALLAFMTPSVDEATENLRMTDHIRPNNLRIFGLLQALIDGVIRHDHKAVRRLRKKLALIARLDEIDAKDDLSKAVLNVFYLTGRWDRNALAGGPLWTTR
jgi:multidrug efflux pump subunit AcrA (membrane-fusion protein)